MQQTAYKSYAYLIPSPTASRLTHHSREDLARCNYPVRCHFPIKVRKKAKGKGRAVSPEGDPPPQNTATTSRAKLSHPTKRKRKEADVPEEDDSVIDISSDVAGEDDEILEIDPSPQSRRDRKPLNPRTRKAESKSNVIEMDPDPEEDIEVPDSDDDGVWMYSHRPPPRQRRRTKSPTTMADLSDF